MIFGGIRHKMPLLVETNSSQVAHYDLLVAESYTHFMLVLERYWLNSPSHFFRRKRQLKSQTRWKQMINTRRRTSRVLKSLAVEYWIWLMVHLFHMKQRNFCRYMNMDIYGHIDELLRSWQLSHSAWWGHPIGHLGPLKNNHPSRKRPGIDLNELRKGTVTWEICSHRKLLVIVRDPLPKYT